MAEHGAAEPNAQLQLGLQAQAADGGAEAGPGAAGDDVDGAAGAMLALAARGEAADGAEGDDAARVFGAMLAPDVGLGPPGDQPVGDQPAAARGEAEHDDDDEIGVEEAIATAAADAGCASTLADALPAMCFLGNVKQLTVVLLGNQIACARAMPTTLRLAQGTDRVEAAAEYAEQLYATPVRPSASKNALTGALLSVLDVVFPQEAPRPDTATRAATARDGSPDTGFIRKAMAVWQVGKEHSHTSKEMPEDDMGRLANGVGALLGFASQGTSGLAAPPQTKIMHKEVQVHKRIPSVGSVQPENIVRAGGDHGIAAPKAEKSKELTAEPTTSSLELRDRFATFCITLAACLTDGHARHARGREDAQRRSGVAGHDAGDEGREVPHLVRPGRPCDQVCPRGCPPRAELRPQHAPGLHSGAQQGRRRDHRDERPRRPHGGAERRHRDA